MILSHPRFFDSISMIKYADFLSQGLSSRGHQTDMATAKPLFSRLSFSSSSKKWLGYLDQFLVFPLAFRRTMRKLPQDTLFVFADHALGPWIPLVKNRPHVVHCHDFMAQRSALGEIPENEVGFTGKMYQSYIRWGYRKAENFICISEKTRADLHQFLAKDPKHSVVVYNGLNQNFEPAEISRCREQLGAEWKIDTSRGYILHVGGNQFYKNRTAVIRIYAKWRENTNSSIPLILVGQAPTQELLKVQQETSFAKDIHFLDQVGDEGLRRFYAGATLLLFPSLDEGFGWPIAEAMASGCPVVTIDKPPMNEVGGGHCFYLPQYPNDETQIQVWLDEAAGVIDSVYNMPDDQRLEFTAAARAYSAKFDAQETVQNLETIYLEILNSYRS